MKKNKVEVVIFIIGFIFSFWLMFSTFSYQDGTIQIATKAWSDFASHIPLIRSFSFGNNFPPEYPLFSGPPIKYHFLFFAFVGILERLGVRLDLAFNIPSALGFLLLIMMIYFFAIKLFKSRMVGILSIIFFLFNSSLDFVNFFAKFPISGSTISDIVTNTQFMSFGPYDGKTISAFWNLNIYTNQRHLALSYAVSLTLIYFLIKPFFDNKKPNFKINILIGVILGLSFFLNIAVFLMTGLIFAFLFLFAKNNRTGIFVSAVIAGIIAIPQYLYIQSGGSGSQILFYPGYLIDSYLTLQSFIDYWFQNLGFQLFLIPLGFIIASKKAKMIFLSFLILFIVGNLFQFSPEIAANHKFFNYFMIVGSMFSAYFLYYLWTKIKFLRPVIPVVIFLLILSGIIDFFPIFNDRKITLADYPINNDVAWIIKNTNPNSVFLNTQYLYDNASLAGRKIFLGWPYFAWSQGYDTLTRDNLRKSMLDTNDKVFFCKSALIYNIDYAEINPTSTDAVDNKSFFDKNFTLSYANSVSQFYIYKIKGACR